MNIQFKDLKTGEVNFERELLPSQQKFWESEKPFVLLNGGMGSGKTMIMLIRALYDAITIPDNFILMGRRTYQEVYDVLVKDFLDICHPSWIKSYKKSPHPNIILHTLTPGKTSEIIFRNLDKMAETDIKGLNLGQIVIDQIEDIPESSFQGLTMRLRRQGCNHRVYATSNPKLNWLFQRIKKENDTKWEAIEMPSTENYIHLPQTTVEIYESYKITDPAYYRQMVQGVWDESLLAENTVFARDHIVRLEKGIREPIKEVDGLKIFELPIKGHRYQMGIDCAEGIESGDNAAVSIVDLDALEEVASWFGKIPPEVVAEKAVNWARMYSSEWPTCVIVPEMNAMGLALLNKLKELGYENIYRREEYDNRLNKKTEKLGWRTSVQTKPLLISNFRHLMQHFEPRIRTKETIAEMKAFVFTDEAKKQGAGAIEGFHDDLIIATLLGFWEKTRRKPNAHIFRKENQGRMPQLELTPSIQVKNGKVKVQDMPELMLIDEDFKSKSWKI